MYLRMVCSDLELNCIQNPAGDKGWAKGERSGSNLLSPSTLWSVSGPAWEFVPSCSTDVLCWPTGSPAAVPCCLSWKAIVLLLQNNKDKATLSVTENGNQVTLSSKCCSQAWQTGSASEYCKCVQSHQNILLSIKSYHLASLRLVWAWWKSPAWRILAQIPVALWCSWKMTDIDVSLILQ